MTQITFQSILDEAAMVATKVRTVLTAVQGSPITQEMEKLIPGLAGLVSQATPVGPVIDAVIAADEFLHELQELGAKPMDANEMARIKPEDSFT